jgi:hypothetical protein
MSHYPKAETKKVEIDLEELFKILTPEQQKEFIRVNKLLDDRDARCDKKKLEGKKTVSVYLPITMAKKLIKRVKADKTGMSPFIISLIEKELEKNE